MAPSGPVLSGRLLRRWFVVMLGAELAASVTGFAAEVRVGCDFGALEAAVTAGGSIIVDCPGPITVGRTMQITASTTIIGTSSQTELNGAGARRIFEVQPGAHLALESLILHQGRHEGASGSTEEAAAGRGGAILIKGGSLTATHCVFRECRAVGAGLLTPPRNPESGNAYGGAIHAEAADLLLADCAFEGNLAQGGDALGGAVHQSGGGSLRALRCLFSRNQAIGGSRPVAATGNAKAGYGGALNYFGGRLLLEDCAFTLNAARGGVGARNNGGGSAAGGAARLGATVTNAVLVRCRFEQNAAIAGMGWESPAEATGGALASRALLHCEESLFRSNRVEGATGIEGGVPGRGGGLWTAGESRVIDSEFDRNIALGGTGAPGPLTAARASDGLGGAVYLEDLTHLAGCSFGGNRAEGGPGYSVIPRLGPAGDGLGGGVYVAGPLTMVNCTLYQNSAVGGSGPSVPGSGIGGGVFLLNGALEGIHLTIAGNFTQAGIGSSWINDQWVETRGQALAGGIVATNGAALTLVHSILSHGVHGENCSASFATAQFNLSSDASCDFGDRGWTNTHPQLGTFSNHGGPTPTVELLEGSPAIDAVATNYPATDQRGWSRPAGATADLGAFERGASAPIVGSLMGPPGDLRVAFKAGPGSALVVQGTEDFRQWTPWVTNTTDAAGSLQVRLNEFPLPVRHYFLRALKR